MSALRLTSRFTPRFTLAAVVTMMPAACNRAEIRQERGGGTEAARFSRRMGRLGAARNASDYAARATPVLDEVDNLERVFAL